MNSNENMKQKDWTEALRDRLKDAQIAPPAEGWEKPLPIPQIKGAHSSPRRSWGWVAAAAAAVLAAVVIVTTTDIFAPHKSGELAVILESQQVNSSTVECCMLTYCPSRPTIVPYVSILNIESNEAT